ncbi:MAG: multicopper oxidase domain-containing protein [Candidatus Heimdallarchaeota archaeon]
MLIKPGNRIQLNFFVVTILFIGLVIFEVVTPQIFLPNEESVNVTFDGHLDSHIEPDIFVNPSSTPQIRRFSLIVEEVEWEVAPGQYFTAWTFNGTIPGPTLGVYENDTVEFSVTNNLAEPISIDVVQPVTRQRVNDTFSRVSIPSQETEVLTIGIPQNREGTWIYRDMVAFKGLTENNVNLDVLNNESVERGLYGAFIIYDRVEPFPAHDVVVFLDSFKPPITNNDDYFAVQNGGAYPYAPHYIFRQGERIRYRAINIDIGDKGDPHTTHIHGHTWRDEGNRTLDNELLLPGEAIDRLIIAKNPGLWMYHCHIYDHIAAGMTGMLSVIPSDWTGNPIQYVMQLMEESGL